VKQNPKKLRAPNSATQQDTREYWSAGKAYYEPETIRVPTTAAGRRMGPGHAAAYMAQALFPKLVNAPYKQPADRRGDAHRAHERTHAAVPRSAGVSRSPAPRP